LFSDTFQNTELTKALSVTSKTAGSKRRLLRKSVLKFPTLKAELVVSLKELLVSVKRRLVAALNFTRMATVLDHGHHLVE
jgi:hypothetical protein